MCGISSHDEIPLVTKNIPLKIGFGSYFFMYDYLKKIFYTLIYLTIS